MKQEWNGFSMIFFFCKFFVFVDKVHRLINIKNSFCSKLDTGGILFNTFSDKMYRLSFPAKKPQINVKNGKVPNLEIPKICPFIKK